MDGADLSQQQQPPPPHDRQQPPQIDPVDPLQQGDNVERETQEWLTRDEQLVDNEEFYEQEKPLYLKDIENVDRSYETKKAKVSLDHFSYVKVMLSDVCRGPLWHKLFHSMTIGVWPKNTKDDPEWDT
ncbi:hypothetical protein Syun_028456 [Stephania yunnanensis]|uniref:Uncharacterized protein n=1 Tax=Stephania yunnanensis TaxID=152371 RepID=A0AAP0EJY1_9MAGN